LTRNNVLGFFVSYATKNPTSNMKKLLVLSMFIPLALICSCQKQDAAAEQQLAQRKAELDAREKALDEREKALAEREKAVARSPKLPTDLQLRSAVKDSSGNPASVPSIPAGLIPTRDNTQLKAERERRIQERLAQRQQRLDELRKTRAMRAQASANAQTSPNAQPTVDGEASGGAGATSPSPTSTPQ
jgi:hypothetical protein